ncbi:MAG: hypothetical protein ACYS74_08680 [Planctomycetota bacterium]
MRTTGIGGRATEDFDEEYEFEYSDSDEVFRDPNDGAYEKEELRTGPPLDYVAEKFRRSMELIHSLIDTLRTAEQMDSAQESMMLSQARGSLRYQLTGYLALKNMLALVNDQGFFERMEKYSCNDFSDWLDRIDQRGMTTG